MQKQVEIEKLIQRHLPQSLSKRAFSGYELYEDFDLSKITFPKNRVRRKSKNALCGKILNACFDLVLTDIIDHNIIFDFELKKDFPTFMSVKLIEGEEFKELYRKGRFPGLDFLKTNFTAPEIVFTYGNKNGEKNVPLKFFSEEIEQRMINNANNGVYN